MPEHTESADVAIVGGGIVGLACAWRARTRGLSVALFERDDVGRGTSHVAAGMLAPVSEVEFGTAGSTRSELGLRSAEMWPEFAAELEEAQQAWVWDLLQTGTLVVARDEDEARELERRLAFRRSLGLRAERLRASEAREREPALAPTVRLAIEAPDDHSVDPRLVLAALRRACEIAGVALREHARGRVGRAGRARRARDRPAAARAASVSAPPTSCSPPARGAADRGSARRARRFPCARSRARSCACAIRPARAC